MKYLDKFNLVDGLVAYAEKRGIKPDAKGIRTSRSIMDITVKSFIGLFVLDDDGFYPIYGLKDNTLEKALGSSSVVTLEQD